MKTVYITREFNTQQHDPVTSEEQDPTNSSLNHHTFSQRPSLLLHRIFPTYSITASWPNYPNTTKHPAPDSSSTPKPVSTTNALTLHLLPKLLHPTKSSAFTRQHQHHLPQNRSRSWNSNTITHPRISPQHLRHLLLHRRSQSSSTGTRLNRLLRHRPRRQPR